MQRFRKSGKSGSVSIQVLVGMVGMLGMSGVALDIGYAYKVKLQLQNIADSASMAAVAEIAEILVALPTGVASTHTLTTLETQQVQNAAQTITGVHDAGNMSIALDLSHVELGKWDYANSTLGLTSVAPGAVRVAAHRTNGTNGPISTVLARAVGVTELGVSATATASLTPLGGLGEGESTLPVGISKAWFDNSAQTCNQPIRFQPTGDLDGCAGWHTYDTSPANAAKLRNVLDGLTDESFLSPPIHAGDTLNFTGGTMSSAFSDMQELFEARRFDEAPFNEMNATVAVYDSPDCGNPSGSLVVAGFASVIITAVYDAPEKTIEAVVKCDIIVAGGGGGGDFGTLSTTAGLVQ